MGYLPHAILLSLHHTFPADTERHGHMMGRRIKQRDGLHLISETDFGIASKMPVLSTLHLCWPDQCSGLRKPPNEQSLLGTGFGDVHLTLCIAVFEVHVLD